MKATTASLLLAFVQLALAHPGGHYEPSEREQAVFEAAKSTSSAGRVNEPAPSTNLWLEKYGEQIDLGYTGPLSFSHAEYARCLQEPEKAFDIAILGMPFDTTTSYRPGARFGPTGIRMGARRQHVGRGYTLSWGLDPYLQGAKVIDCGDIPLNGYDNAVAIDQMEVAYSTLLAHPVAKDAAAAAADVTASLALDGRAHPRVLTLGGDHTIVLPILRSLNKVYGPVSVIHFDAHLDTWKPAIESISEQSRITHGSFFYIAHEENLIRNASIHGGIRCKMAGETDIQNDESVGFKVVSSDDIDDLGIAEVIRRIRSHIGTNPVYVTLDIDTIDPGLAPATGTPEAGGWTTREVKRIIRGLAGMNIVGADIVEVAPAYDTADITSIAAADIAHDFLAAMLSSEPPKSRDERSPWKDEL
ncbi:Arginase/deacetylase [Peniophora sp. CONT]|nr:Arginase/deacetylase [Peniophora sp. CONT]